MRYIFRDITFKEKSGQITTKTKELIVSWPQMKVTNPAFLLLGEILIHLETCSQPPWAVENQQSTPQGRTSVWKLWMKHSVRTLALPHGILEKIWTSRDIMDRKLGFHVSGDEGRSKGGIGGSSKRIGWLVGWLPNQNIPFFKLFTRVMDSSRAIIQLSSAPISSVSLVKKYIWMLLDFTILFWIQLLKWFGSSEWNLWSLIWLISVVFRYPKKRANISYSLAYADLNLWHHK